MLKSLFSDANTVVLWRAKGGVASFPFSNVLVLHDPGGSHLITSQLVRSLSVEEPVDISLSTSL